MFFLPLSDWDCEILTKLAKKKGTSIQEFARQVLFNGVYHSVQMHRERPNDLEKIYGYIREHWMQESDEQMGKVFQYSASYIRILRLQIGLSRKTTSLWDRIDREKFERMIVHGGYTLSEFCKSENLQCTREYLRQIAEEHGLKYSPHDRAPEWLLMRKARKLGNLNLANRDWLAEGMARSVSIASLAAELGIDERNLFFFIRRFGLTHPSLRKYGTETVVLVCANCTKEFPRLKSWVDVRFKRSKGKARDFFCSTLCSSRYGRERVNQKNKDYAEQAV